MKNLKFLFLIIFINISNLLFAADYYWRGSSNSTNDWNDIQNWKIMDNGEIIGAPNGIPTFTDNVFFDNNSFTTDNQTITISGIANCNNINFIGTDINIAPILTGNGSLNIYGDAIWQEGMNINVTNILFGDFSTNISRNIILNNNVTFNSTITIKGTDSSITNLSNGENHTTNNNGLNINGELYIIGGIFNTNNIHLNINTIYTSRILSTFEYKLQELNLSNSTLNIFNLFIHNDTTYFGSNAKINIGNNTSGGSINANSKTFGDVDFNTGSSNLAGSIKGSNNTFNNVTFKNSKNIEIDAYNNSFNNLILAPSSYVYLRPNTSEDSSIINITESFILNTLPCSIASTLSNSSTTFTSSTPITIKTLNTSTEVRVNNSIINLINVDGHINGIASNTTFNHPYTGWTIEAGDNADFYWVGGNGSWSQIQHWSSTSGGEPGTCIPGPENNVYIDNNSSNSSSLTITIDITANLKDLEINNITTTLTGYTLFNIYGSAKFTSGSRINNLNTYFKNSNQDKIFDPNGLTYTGGTLYLEEQKTITVLSNYNGNQSNHLYHNNGTFDLSQNEITFKIASYQEQNNTNSKTLKLGQSTLELIGESPTLYLSNGNLTVEPGTSTIIFNPVNIKTQPYNSSSGLQLNSNKFYDFYNVTFNDYAHISGRSNKDPINGKTANTFNNLTLNKSSRINTIANINNLTLASNTITEISGTSDGSPAIYINSNLNGTNTDNCSNWSYLKSLYKNNPVYIELSSGVNPNIKNFTIEGIKLIGGTATAINSINEGNNEGWNFSTSPTTNNLYWIGGSGNWSDPNHWSFTSGINNNPNSCLPNPITNTFFDAGSGFNESSKTITIDTNALTKDITFNGNSTPPILKSFKSGSNQPFYNFYIYGNSTMQENMSVELLQINYKNSNSVRTITSNNIIYNINYIYLQESNTIGLADNLNLDNGASLIINDGTFNTNNYEINLNAGNFRMIGSPLYDNRSSSINNGYGSRIINLGNSNINFDNAYEYGYNIQTDIASNIANYTVLNAGTSTITFKSNKVNNAPMNPNYLLIKDGQKLYNVNFYVYPDINKNNLEFNEVYFYINANISGNYNTFKKMILASNHTYLFGNNTTQNITDLIIRGTPCAFTTINKINQNNNTNYANLKITGNNTTFNYTDIGNINAIITENGKSLTFEGQSVNRGNNMNINFEPSNPSYFIGFGSNWFNHTVNNNIPSTYLLNTDNFIPDAFSTYEWKKIAGINSNQQTIISTDSHFDFRNDGYGTYKAIVNYNDFLGEFICNKDAEITITPARSIINPNIRIKAKKTTINQTQ